MWVLYRGYRCDLDAALVSKLTGPVPPDGCETNGAGPERMGPGLVGRVLARLVTALVPDTVAGGRVGLYAACWHDYAYSLGQTWEDRRRADYGLARNIVTVLSEAGNLSAIRVFSVALAYWFGVRLGGWAAFRYGPERGPASMLRRAFATAWRAPFAALGIAREVRMTKAQIAAALAKLNAQQAAIAEKYAALAKAAAVAEPPPKPAPIADTPVPVPPKPKPPKVTTSRPREMHALVIGRNKFGPGGRPSESDLAGCLEDMNNWSVAARANGYDLTILPDGRATRANVDRWFAERLERAENGDALFFAIASHGTLISSKRDPLGQENAACLDIYDRPGDDGFRSGLLSSWDFADWAVSLPSEITLTVVGDCCHLGLQRASLIALEKPRALANGPVPYQRARFLEAPFGVRPKAGAALQRAMVGEATTLALPQLNAVIVTTCQTTQTAADARINGRPCGAGSHYLLDAIRRMPGASVQSIVEEAGNNLARGGYDQDPAAHGSPAHLSQPFAIGRVA